MNSSFRRSITAQEQAVIDASWDVIVAKLNKETAAVAGPRPDADSSQPDAVSRPNAGKSNDAAASWDEVVARINSETAAASGRGG
jgi:hypothetical protein